MRLLGRLLLVLGLAAIPVAVTTPIGCGLDQVAHLPGLKDSLPNQPGGAGFIGGSLNDGGSGGSVGTGGATVSNCVACNAQVIMQNQPCVSAESACANAQACVTDTQCVGACLPTDGGAADPACFAACLSAASPEYSAYHTCLCTNCAAECTGELGCSGSGPSGPALTICDVAAAANVSASTCATCVGHTSGVPDPTGCETENMACSSDALCQAALTCIATCKAGANLDNCVVQCLDLSSVYQGLLQCMFGICKAACGEATPLACNITDGG